MNKACLGLSGQIAALTALLILPLQAAGHHSHAVGAAKNQPAPPTNSMADYTSNSYTCANYLADLPVVADYTKAGRNATSEQVKRTFVIRSVFSSYASTRLFGVPNTENVRTDQNQSAALANELTALCKANKNLNFADITTGAPSQQAAHNKIMQLLSKIKKMKPDVNSTLLGVLDAQESQKVTNMQEQAQ